MNPVVGCRYFPPGPQLPSQPSRGLLSVLLLGEQRHKGCEQFAYKTVTRQRRIHCVRIKRPFCYQPALSQEHAAVLAAWRGVVVSGVRRMNQVNARRARSVLGWVTVFGWVYLLGM